MEKNFTLMKTLSAFLDLLFFHSRKKNVCALKIEWSACDRMLHINYSK